MTQFPTYDDVYEEPRSQTNTLGLVGFILAFCISPIGLILSLIALFKAPRGFAIAGVVVGLVGTVLWFVIGSGIFMVASVALKGKEAADKLTAVQTALEGSKAPDGTYPADLTGISTGQDPWGNDFVYERTPDAKGYLLISKGADGRLETSDDIMTKQGMPSEVNFVLATFGVGGDMMGSWGNGAVGAHMQVSSRMWLIALALDKIIEKGGDFPARLEEVEGLSPRLIVDPWGTPLVYTPAADHKSYSLRSNGPDKQPGTGDDIDAKQVTGQFEQTRARARDAQKAQSGRTP